MDKRAVDAMCMDLYHLGYCLALRKTGYSQSVVMAIGGPRALKYMELGYRRGALALAEEVDRPGRTQQRPGQLEKG